ARPMRLETSIAPAPAYSQPRAPPTRPTLSSPCRCGARSSWRGTGARWQDRFIGLLARRPVGWVERSETHRVRSRDERPSMGFAIAQPILRLHHSSSVFGPCLAPMGLEATGDRNWRPDPADIAPAAISRLPE